MEFTPIDSRHTGYLTDESRQQGSAEAICFPEDTAQLAEALKTASRQGIAVTVQGARTGLFGEAVPRGGLIVSLERMNGILGLDEQNDSRRLRVQAGATLAQIESFLLSKGLFFPPDPTEKTATIGGVFASGAEGLSALRYGAASLYVEELTRVKREGETQNLKRGDFVAGGRDLIDALGGSGDAFGAAAEMTLTLRRVPREIWGLVFFFREKETVYVFTEALRNWRKKNAQTLRCAEFLNSGALKLTDGARGSYAPVKNLPAFPQNATCAIYAELEGDEALDAALSQLLELFALAGGFEEDTWAESGFSGIAKLRDLRHAVPEIIGAQTAQGGGGTRGETLPAAPPNKAAECIDAYTQAAEQANTGCVIYGNILQNRLHLTFLDAARG